MDIESEGKLTFSQVTGRYLDRKYKYLYEGYGRGGVPPGEPLQVYGQVWEREHHQGCKRKLNIGIWPTVAHCPLKSISSISVHRIYFLCLTFQTQSQLFIDSHIKLKTTPPSPTHAVTPHPWRMELRPLLTVCELIFFLLNQEFLAVCKNLPQGQVDMILYKNIYLEIEDNLFRWMRPLRSTTLETKSIKNVLCHLCEANIQFLQTGLQRILSDDPRREQINVKPLVLDTALATAYFSEPDTPSM